VSNYGTADSILQSILSRASCPSLGLHSFIRAVELQPQCGGLRLLSFLIMPVQRVPRYKMLLAELIKNTDSSHPDYSNLAQALALVSGVAASLNTDMKDLEVRKKTMDVAAQFEAFSLLTPSRLFVKAASLKKVCRAAKKEFTFVLFNDCIIYGSPKLTGSLAPNGEKYHKLHREISLHNSFLVGDVPNLGEGFLLVNSEKSFYVDCGTAAAKSEWVEAIAAQHADLFSKLQMPSSWRFRKDERENGEKHGEKHNEVAVWGMDGNNEGSSGSAKQIKEVWGLTPSAMSQGRGMLTIVSPANVQKLGEPAIALLSRTGADQAEGGGKKPRGSAFGKVGHAVRRMSGKFSAAPSRGSPDGRDGRDGRDGSGGIEDGSSREVEEEGNAVSAAAAIDGSGGGGSGGGGSSRPGSAAHDTDDSRPSSAPQSSASQSTIVEMPSAPPSRSPSIPALAAARANRRMSAMSAMSAPPSQSGARPVASAASRYIPANKFLDDSKVKYTGEFPVKMSVYGLGLELVDSSSPYSDHPSQSIVRAQGFSRLFNGNESPAMVAGVEVGDYIVALDGVGVGKVHEVKQLLEAMGVMAGAVVRVRVRRGGFPGAGAGAGGGGGGGADTADLLGLGASAFTQQQTHQTGNNNDANNEANSNHHHHQNAAQTRPPYPPPPPPSRGGTASVMAGATSPPQGGSRPPPPARPRREGPGDRGPTEEERQSRVDVMELSEIEFLNLLGVTKHKYRGMEEEERARRRADVGL